MAEPFVPTVVYSADSAEDSTALLKTRHNGTTTGGNMSSALGKGRRGELSINTKEKIVMPLQVEGWPQDQIQGRLRGSSTASSTSSTAYTLTPSNTTPSTPFSQTQTLVSSLSQFSSAASSPSTHVYASYSGLGYLRRSNGGDQGKLGCVQGKGIIQAEKGPSQINHVPHWVPVIGSRTTNTTTTTHQIIKPVAEAVASANPADSATGTKGWTGLISRMKSKSSSNLKAKLAADQAKDRPLLPKPSPTLPTIKISPRMTEESLLGQPPRAALKRDDTKRSLSISTLSSKQTRRKGRRRSEDSFECGGGAGSDDDGDAGPADGGMEHGDRADLSALGFTQTKSGGMPGVALAGEFTPSVASPEGSAAIPDVPALPSRFQHHLTQSQSRPQPASPLFPTSSMPPTPIMMHGPPLARLDSADTTASTFRARDGGYTTGTISRPTRQPSGQQTPPAGHSNERDARDGYFTALALSLGDRERYPTSPEIASPTYRSPPSGWPTVTSPTAGYLGSTRRSSGTSLSLVPTPGLEKTPITASDGFALGFGADPFGIAGQPFDEDERRRQGGMVTAYGGAPPNTSSPVESQGELLPPRAAFSQGPRLREGHSPSDSAGSAGEGSGLKGLRASPSMNSLRKFGQGLRDSLVSSGSSRSLPKQAQDHASLPRTPLKPSTLKHSRTSPSLKALGKSQLGMSAPEIHQTIQNSPAAIEAGSETHGLRPSASMFFRKAKSGTQVSARHGEVSVAATLAMPTIIPASPVPTGRVSIKETSSATSDGKQAKPRLSLKIASLRGRSLRNRASREGLPGPAFPPTAASPTGPLSLSRRLPPGKDPKSLTVPSLPSGSSFSDLYRELGVSPPASDDDDDMPYTPSSQADRLLPRLPRRQSALSVASLAPTAPLPTPPPLKLRSSASTPHLRTQGRLDVIQSARPPMPYMSTMPPATKHVPAPLVESPIEMTGSDDLGGGLAHWLKLGWGSAESPEAGDAGMGGRRQHGTRTSDLNSEAALGTTMQHSSTMSSFQTHRGRHQAGGSGSRSRFRSPSIPRRRGCPPMPSVFKPVVKKGPPLTDSEDSSDESDNRPLAERNSGALRAQKSLRSLGKKARKDELTGGYLVKGPSAGLVQRIDAHRGELGQQGSGRGASTPAWDGEGGVPAGLLERKLSELLKIREESELGATFNLKPASFLTESLAREGTHRSTRAGGDMALSRRARTEASRGADETKPSVSPVPGSSSSHSQSQAVGGGQGSSLSVGNAKGLTAGLQRSDDRRASHFRTIPVVQPLLREPTVRRSDQSVIPAGLAPRSRNASAPRQDTLEAVTATIRVYAVNLDGSSILREVSSDTTAADVLTAFVKGIDDSASYGRGGWAQWTLLAVTGDVVEMERPVRAWETIQQVMHSSMSGLHCGIFVAKRSSLHPLTSQRLVPGNFPARAGFVQWESKPGKWTKRWLEMRDGSVFLAKNDKGKESAFLCSSSSFDVYRPTHPMKAPKPFIIMLQSDDPPTMFENLDDYKHNFSCDEALGATLYAALHSAKSVASLQHRSIDASASADVRRPAAEPLIALKDPDAFAYGSLLGKGKRRT